MKSMLEAVAAGIAATLAGAALNSAAIALVVFNPVVAATLWGLAATAAATATASFAAATYLAGELTAANNDVRAASEVVLAWEREVANAREQVLSLCNRPQASDCLSSPAPC